MRRPELNRRLGRARRGRVADFLLHVPQELVVARRASEVRRRLVNHRDLQPFSLLCPGRVTSDKDAVALATAVRVELLPQPPTRIVSTSRGGGVFPRREAGAASRPGRSGVRRCAAMYWRTWTATPLRHPRGERRVRYRNSLRPISGKAATIRASVFIIPRSGEFMTIGARSRFVRIGALVVLSLAAFASLPLAAQQSAPAAPAAKPVFADGQAQIVPAFQDAAQWIRQTLWVETEFDSDGDGKRDRVHVDVTRPRQTETEGLKVPVIYESSPYFAGTSGDRAVPLGREAGARRASRRRARRSRRSRSGRRATSISNSQVDDLGAARLRRRALGGAGHGALAGLPDGRRRAGAARAEGRHRLAERPREGLHDARRQRGGRRDVVVHRQGRHDRHVVQRHAPARRGDHRRRRARGDHPDRAEHVVLPLLPLERPGPASRAAGSARTSTSSTTSSTAAIPARRDYCNARYRDGEFAEGRDRATGDYNDFWAARDLLPKVGTSRPRC